MLRAVLRGDNLHGSRRFFVRRGAGSRGNGGFHPSIVIQFPRNEDIIVSDGMSLATCASTLTTRASRRQRELVGSRTLDIHGRVSRLTRGSCSGLMRSTVNFILVFVPGRADCVTTVGRRPSLDHCTCRGGIVVVSPDGLLVTLRLTCGL